MSPPPSAVPNELPATETPTSPPTSQKPDTNMQTVSTPIDTGEAVAKEELHPSPSHATSNTAATNATEDVSPPRDGLSNPIASSPSSPLPVVFNNTASVFQEVFPSMGLIPLSLSPGTLSAFQIQPETMFVSAPVVVVPKPDILSDILAKQLESDFAFIRKEIIVI
jgi:hypothetical protein